MVEMPDFIYNLILIAIVFFPKVGRCVEIAYGRSAYNVPICVYIYVLISTLKRTKIFIFAGKIMRKMTAASIWIC